MFLIEAGGGVRSRSQLDQLSEPGGLSETQTRIYLGGGTVVLAACAVGPN